MKIITTYYLGANLKECAICTACFAIHFTNHVNLLAIISQINIINQFSGSGNLEFHGNVTFKQTVKSAFNDYV